MDTSEGRLVERLVAGEQAAFDEFFSIYFPRLYRFVLSRLRRDPALAEEIVQSALCKVVTRFGAFRGESTLFSWLCTFCRHEIGAHLRRARRHGRAAEQSLEDPGSESLVGTLADSRPDATVLIESVELAERVHATLDALPGRYGDVLEWKYLQGLSVNEIAERLRLGPKAAESLLTRARQAFREAFDERGTPVAGEERERA